MGYGPIQGAASTNKGVPRSDRNELRALLQERVLEYTVKDRRDHIEEMLAAGATQEEAESSARLIIEEFDPVVALAITAVHRSSTLDQQIRCNSEIAQYVRPKLKSVDVTVDPEALESMHERQRLTENLVSLLTAAAAAKKTTT